MAPGSAGAVRGAWAGRARRRPRCTTERPTWRALSHLAHTARDAPTRTVPGAHRAFAADALPEEHRLASRSRLRLERRALSPAAAGPLARGLLARHPDPPCGDRVRAASRPLRAAVLRAVRARRQAAEGRPRARWRRDRGLLRQLDPADRFPRFPRGRPRPSASSRRPTRRCFGCSVSPCSCSVCSGARPTAGGSASRWRSASSAPT